MSAVVVVFAFAVLSIYGIRVVTGERTFVKKCACLLLLMIVASKSIEIIITIINWPLPLRSFVALCVSLRPLAPTHWLHCASTPFCPPTPIDPAGLLLLLLCPPSIRLRSQLSRPGSSASQACRSDPTAASQPATVTRPHSPRLASRLNGRLDLKTGKKFQISLPPTPHSKRGQANNVRFTSASWIGCVSHLVCS